VGADGGVAIRPATADELPAVCNVLDGEEILAVAVRRRRRSQGIGTALVAAAGDRREEVVAEFDERVRPFWVALGFDIEDLDEADRYRGRRRG